ncbi:MAG: hypothetical protein BJ554DRAFT_7852, partial [Olpidium bornovanus]
CFGGVGEDDRDDGRGRKEFLVDAVATPPGPEGPRGTAVKTTPVDPADPHEPVAHLGDHDLLAQEDRRRPHKEKRGDHRVAPILQQSRVRVVHPCVPVSPHQFLLAPTGGAGADLEESRREPQRRRDRDGQAVGADGVVTVGSLPYTPTMPMKLSRAYAVSDPDPLGGLAEAADSCQTPLPVSADVEGGDGQMCQSGSANSIVRTAADRLVTGEKLANLFGISQPKYAWAIEEHERWKRYVSAKAGSNYLSSLWLAFPSPFCSHPFPPRSFPSVPSQS